MATATTDILNLNGDVNSEATIFGPERVGVSTNVGCNIYQGVKISIDKPKTTGIVIRPFVIGLIRTKEGYMASSRISNAYELGVTPYQAIKSYLEFLVDELLWLRKNEENLSTSICEDLYLLQNYLRIV